MSKTKEIQKVVDITNLKEISSAVIGISNLSKLTKLCSDDVKKSRGEFAGYLIENDELIVFRDRLGARNIYYAVDGTAAYVSTDPVWIAKAVKAEANWSYILSDYLQFQIPFSEATFFAGVNKVMPGEFVRITKQGIKKEKYWDIEFGRSSFDPQHLLYLMKDAVEYRLKLLDGNNYTSYLSGGLDSSAVTILARPKVSYSGFYEEEGYSEMDYIESVVSKSDFIKKYVKVEITEENFQEQLSVFPEILPDPCAGLGILPQVLVAQEAKKHNHHYAFTGEGGDEIFLGYNWNTIMFTLADAAKNLLRDRYMVRYEPMVEKVLRDGFPTLAGGLLARGNDTLYATKKILEVWDHNESVENNVLKINLKVGLPAILTVDEYVGKYTGIEPVSPIMDHHIVEYVCSVDPQNRAPIPKFMMREALKGILPEKVRMRYDKMGFPVPYQKWNWGLIKPMITSLANRKVMDIDINKHTTMDRETWALYSIESWYQYYFEKLRIHE
jgi:asparagine synthase (glutamine-hydrolysing)